MQLKFILLLVLQPVLVLAGQISPTPHVLSTMKQWPACDTDADWIKYSGKDDIYCYFFSAGLSGSGRSKDWKDANDYCMESGGYLASIHNEEENNFLHGYLTRYGDIVNWIGLREYGNEMYMWSDGSTFDYWNWALNQPDDANGEEECVEFYSWSTSDGVWNDVNCGKEATFVCRKRNGDVLPVTHPATPSPVGNCKTGYFRFDNQCYMIYGDDESDRKPWYDARTACRSEVGRDLATIHSYEMQTFLTSRLIDVDYNLYIGLSDSETSGQFYWTDGSAVDYTNWNSGEPNDQGNGEDCVEMHYAEAIAGKWNDILCTYSRGYVCQTDLDPNVAPPPVETSYCRDGFTRYSYSCFQVVPGKNTFSGAQQDCQALGDDVFLATVNSIFEEAFAETLSHTSGGEPLWIGLYDDTASDQYMWTDGQPVWYTSWGPNEPSAGQDEGCVALLPTGGWDDTACNYIYKPLCFYSLVPACDTDTDWIKYSGKDDTYCYFFSAGLSGSGRSRDWNDANDYCMERGGYLASIHNEEENNFIFNYLTRYGDIQSWLGFREYTTEGVYTWSDGSAVDYQNWGASEPNDANGEEQCVDVYSWDGSWNDANCGKETTFICRKRNGAVLPVTHPATPSPVGNCKTGYLRFDNRCYKIYGDDESDRKTWYDARTACRSETGRDLVTIHSYELQTFLVSKLIDIDYNLYIGLSDILNSGQFYWTDGSTEDYTNWNSGEPNDYWTGEDCVEMYHTESVAGKWSDTLCTYSRGYVCQTDLDPNVAPPPVETSDCRNGFTQYNNSCFQVVPGTNTFSGAQQDCQALGDNVYLATISRIYEEAFAETLSHTSGGEPLWIGLYDDQESGRYMWTDSHPVWYTSWGPNEPSAGQDEGCVALLPTGGWDDTACNYLYKPLCYYSLVTTPTDHPNIPGNCSESWTPYGSNCYKAVNGYWDNQYSWPEAQFFCKQDGGSLASLHSKQETGFVKSMVEGGYTNVWLGLSRGDSGGFVWSDDTPVDYTNWNGGEPSYETQPGIEDCVEMYEASGKWNDLDCLQNMGYVCKTPKTPVHLSSTINPSTTNPEKPIMTTPSVTGVISEPHSGMSGGAIAGVVIGVIILICGGALLAFFLMTKQSSLDITTPSPKVPGSVGFDNVLYKNDGEPNIQVVNEYSINSQA